ncbi:MAG: hypothetical protein ABW007_16310 [Chitinophagaceae bacterium]
MLKLIVIGSEYFDNDTQTFETVGTVELELEHSLLSLSKWESKHQKPFLSNLGRSTEEVLDYIEAMIMTPDYPQDIIGRLDQGNLDAINKYIESKESATTFGSMPERRGRGEVITAELIYYWMVAFNIPFECERWHLNRLFALIRICNIKNSKPTKISRHEMMARNRELNEKRKAEFNTKG